MRRIEREERAVTLRIGKRNMLFAYLCDVPAYDSPLWDRVLTALFFFAMGVVQVFAGLTGLYSSEAIVWIGTWMVIIPWKIRKCLGVKPDPELSDRIVDPRNRIAALDAIEQSRAEARSMRPG